MLKVAQPASNAFHNFKCGEIFCTSPVVYNVTCCLCSTKMHLDQFPSHFQMQHLTLAEESINLQELEQKRNAQLANYAHLLDNMTIKEKDPEDDPIKQESEKVTDEEDTSLQQYLRNREENVHSFHTKLETYLNIGDKFKVRSVSKNTANFTKSFIKAIDLGGKKSQEEKLHELSKENTKGKELKVKIYKDEELKEYNNDDVDMDRHCPSDNKIWDTDKCDSDSNNNPQDECDNDAVDVGRDWLLEDKKSDTDSDHDDNNSLKNELAFPCHTCKRSYRSKRSLQKHNYNVHSPRKQPKKPKEPKNIHKCDECDEIFRSVRDLRGHKSKHKGIFCDVCGKTFTQTGNMMRHKIRHTGIKDYKCKECDNDFFTDKELKAHMIRHTGHMPFMCEICGKRCRDRGVLKAHMRRHTGERPAKCDVCGKSFFSFHDLNVHAVTHSSERPFKCDICGSTFQRKKSLRIHKLIHSNDRKHVCKICGKRFAQSSGLNSHMRTHDAALQPSTNELAEQALAPLFLDRTYINT